MENFSHGLLYSVSPEHFSQLHIDEEKKIDSDKISKFSWQYADSSLAKSMFLFLKMTARKLGLVKLYK